MLMRGKLRPSRSDLANVAYLVCGILIVTDIVAIILQATNKHVTEVSVINPMSWLLAPTTASNGWIFIVIIAVIALLVCLLGVRLKRHAVRK